MKNLLFLFVLSFFISKDEYVFENDFDYFRTDNLGMIYLIADEKVQQYNAEGKKLFEYNNFTLGDIGNLDQTSALRTLLFYPEQSAFLILDNTLSPQNPRVQLTQFGLNYITLMCASENNHYWCFSKELNSVIRLDQQLNAIATGMDLNQLINQPTNPTQILEWRGKVYLNDPDNGIHIFDTYGNFEKSLDIKNIEQIDVDDTHLYYLINNKISKYHLENFIDETVVESTDQIDGISIERESVFYSSGKKIMVVDKD